MPYRIRPGLMPVSSLGGGLVVFVGEGASMTSQDPEAGRLAACIAEEKLPAESQSSLLANWIERGLVVPSEMATAPEDAFWLSAEVSPRISRAARVELLCLEQSCANLLAQALSSAGFQLGNDGLLIAVLNDYLCPEARELHIACREQHRPWMPVKAVGHTIWIGPVFTHDSGQPCWNCLAQHIRRNRWPQGVLFGHDNGSYPPEFPTPAPFCGSVLSACAAQILGFWARGSDRFDLEGNIFTFDTRALHLQAHALLRSANCADCATGAGGITRRTLAGFRELVSPICGVVPAVDLRAREGGLFHARAQVLQPLPLGSSRALMRPNTSVGKGVTPDIAEITCLAEAVERYSIVFQGSEPRTRARIAREIEVQFDPGELLQFSPTQYFERERWADTEDPRLWIPQPYLPDLEIEWTEVTSLRDPEVRRHVPSSFCYLGYPDQTNCRPDTNGCAAGQSREAAILRALLELVERDAAAIWWYNRLRRPGIDPHLIRNPEALTILRDFKHLNRQVHLLDLTNDFGIPVYAAITVTDDGREPFLGLGCALDGQQAAYRALAEMCQVWYWIRDAAGEDPLWHDWLQTASLNTETYLSPSGETAPAQSPVEDDASAELSYCVRRLSELGHDPYALDMTRSDIGVPVYRVIAPGLRHFWPRFAPGRLYDVPVRLGWLDRTTAEADLNPVPCLL